MRYLLLIALLVTSLAVPGLAPGPGLAAASASLPYSGSTFGGVPGVSYSGTGTMTLTVLGKTFGTLTRVSCTSSGCTYTGTIAGKAVTLDTTSSLPGTGMATSSSFGNHGDWVSAVAQWANTNLTGTLTEKRGMIISGAAGIQGQLMWHDRGGGHGGMHGRP